MKLTIKTLQNSTFKVDIEPDKTVKELKNVIEQEQGKDYPSGSQKLIYNGKILTDENKLAEYEFDEKKFVVLMTTRPPPVPKPQAAATTPTTATTTTTTTTSTTTEQTSSSAKQTDQQTKTAAAAEQQNKPTTAQATTTLATTTNTTTSTTPAQPRGEQRSAASGQQHRSAQAASAAQMSAAAAAALADMSALSMGEPQIGARLAALMSQPHFRQMQDLIQQSPHLLSSTIESLAASDPEMYSFISENPDIFVSALNHPPMAGLNQQSSDNSALGQQRQGRIGGLGGGGGGQQQPVVDQLLGDVTEHDKQAIERLKELGFSEYLAVQAYMACDKDEQLAANLLFQMD